MLAVLLLLTPFTTHATAWQLITGLCVLLLVTAAVSRVPWSYLLSRTALVLPFSALIVMVNYFAGNFSLEQMALTITKSIVSVFSIILLVSTTPFHQILKQLGKWGVPRLIILILSFMYRYFFLLVGEIEALEKAVGMRHANLSGWRRIKTYASMIAMLLVRSFDRAERVFHAMEMRGFTGDLR